MGKHGLPDLKEGPIYNAPEWKTLVICSIHEIDTYDNQDVKKTLKTLFWLLQHEITDRGYTWDYYHKYYGPLYAVALFFVIASHSSHR